MTLFQIKTFMTEKNEASNTRVDCALQRKEFGVISIYTFLQSLNSHLLPPPHLFKLMSTLIGGLSPLQSQYCQFPFYQVQQKAREYPKSEALSKARSFLQSPKGSSADSVACRMLFPGLQGTQGCHLLIYFESYSGNIVILLVFLNS